MSTYEAPNTERSPEADREGLAWQLGIWDQIPSCTRARSISVSCQWLSRSSRVPPCAPDSVSSTSAPGLGVGSYPRRLSGCPWWADPRSGPQLRDARGGAAAGRSVRSRPL